VRTSSVVGVDVHVHVDVVLDEFDYPRFVVPASARVTVLHESHAVQAFAPGNERKRPGSHVTE
jgi:hypothetical protein